MLCVRARAVRVAHQLVRRIARSIVASAALRMRAAGGSADHRAPPPTLSLGHGSSQPPLPTRVATMRHAFLGPEGGRTRSSPGAARSQAVGGSSSSEAHAGGGEQACAATDTTEDGGAAASGDCAAAGASAAAEAATTTAMAAGAATKLAAAAEGALAYLREDPLRVLLEGACAVLLLAASCLPGTPVGPAPVSAWGGMVAAWRWLATLATLACGVACGIALYGAFTLLGHWLTAWATASEDAVVAFSSAAAPSSSMLGLVNGPRGWPGLAESLRAAAPSGVLATSQRVPLLLFACLRLITALTFACLLALVARLVAMPLLSRLPQRLHRLLRHRLILEPCLVCAHVATFTAHPAIGLLIATAACAAGRRHGRGAGRLSLCALAALAPGGAAWCRHVASASGRLASGSAGVSSGWLAQVGTVSGWQRLVTATSALSYSTDAQWAALHVTALVLARQLGSRAPQGRALPAAAAGGGGGTAVRTRSAPSLMLRLGAAAAAVLCMLASAGGTVAAFAESEEEPVVAPTGSAGAALGMVISDEVVRIATIGTIIVELL